jgi:hypothetical protein
VASLRDGQIEIEVTEPTGQFALAATA